jgi:DNA-binding MarR family transcriptional regulator
VVLAVRAWTQDVQAGTGLSGAQLFVLQKLAEAPAPSLNDLARRTLTSKAAVSVVVARLARRRLVRRQASTVDGRLVGLAITPAGRVLLGRAPHPPQERLLAALGGLPPGDLAAFAAHFEDFVAKLGISSLEPGMLFEQPAGGTEVPAARPRASVTRRR